MSNFLRVYSIPIGIQNHRFANIRRLVLVFGRRLVLVLYERRANNENKNYKYNKIISFIQVISGHSFSSNYIGIQTNAI